ncbi:uncharacterized protein TNCV_1266351 [Trichonephila clavipes]|nr:uncharacterized protein TNCV_1266351 [Trichonephila clavipes]
MNAPMFSSHLFQALEGHGSLVVKSLGSNPGEGMDICKCIVPSQHGDTLNSRRAASPLVRFLVGEELWEAPAILRVFSLKEKSKSGKEQNRTVTCMVLKVKANDRCKNLALSHDEIRGP